jgi:S-adenosylmethionine:tRNA ribosyltransferase-isomerase
VRRELFDYDLPAELIAGHPAPERDGARLLVMDSGDDGGVTKLIHAAVRDLDQHLVPGALLVVNDTRVIPARLLGHKAGSGGKVELLLVRRLEATSMRSAGRELAAERWRALGRASKPLRPGARVNFGGAGHDGGHPQTPGGVPLAAEIATAAGEGGVLEVLLFSPAGLALDVALEAAGRMPLPPYLHRPDEAADRERYQTVFARVPGAIAAPTAGLHLSSALLERASARGVALATVTLHVGLGTFQPVTVEDLDHHPMHSEVFAVPAETAAAIAAARDRGAPVVAVGTTVVRALESAADPEREGYVRAAEGETRLLIQPGYRFRVVDQLLTNFHLPHSTLLAMVAAFAGRERVLAAYRAAIDARYRFYSYGDAMFIRAREAA